MPITNPDVVVFYDLETSSINTRTCDVTQLAAIAMNVKTDIILGEFEMKIQFDESKADPESLRVSGYNRKTWERHAVSQVGAIMDFKRFLDRYPSVDRFAKIGGKVYSVSRGAGHYNEFDRTVLGNWVSRVVDTTEPEKRPTGLTSFVPMELRGLCTVHLAMWYFKLVPGQKEPSDYKLHTLLDHFGIPHDKSALHDAAVDCKMTVELFRAIKRGLRKK